MDPDTSIGGKQQRFPQTNQSAIIGVRSDDAVIRQRAFETILANYWKPAYKYVRVKWKTTNEDAKDLTQGFFAAAFEKNYFSDHNSQKASFQTFLRTCLDGFVSNQRKSESRQKRGGDVAHFSLDFVSAEHEFLLTVPSNEITPEEYFHREWVRNLFTLSVGTMRNVYENTGREVQFRLFEVYDLGERDADASISYASLAREYGISASTITNYLAAARRDFKRVLLDNLRAITSTEEEFRREARELLGVTPK
jgi:DNA-directed RNA polymerase specialized sigma24 family protein